MPAGLSALLQAPSLNATPPVKEKVMNKIMKEKTPSDDIIYKGPGKFEMLYASLIYSGDDIILFEPQQISISHRICQKVIGSYIVVSANHFQHKS